MPAVAKPKNSHAPNDPTLYDGAALAPHGSQEQYYKLLLQKERMDRATGGLSAAEKAVVQQPSDLDMLTAKILVKLKTMADHAPYLNTLRAITGKESREDIAEDLATRHYNKHITDYYVAGVVDSAFTGQVIGGRGNVRRALRGQVLAGGGDAMLGGGLTHAAPTPADATVGGLLTAFGINLPGLGAGAGGNF